MGFDLGELSARVSLDTRDFRREANALPDYAESGFKKTAAAAGRYLTLATLALGMRSAVRESMNFSRELYNIRSIAPEMQLANLNRELVTLDSKLGSATQNAAAFYFAYSAGARGSEKELTNFVAISSRLARSIVADNTTTMDALTSILNAYRLGVGGAGEAADFFFQIVKQGKTTGSALANSIGTIASTAASAGVSLDDLGNGIATLTTTMPTERAITNLNGLITAFIKPTDQARVAAAKYGVELSAAALRTRGLAGVIAELHEKVGNDPEALAAIIPNLEGFKAAVALSGTQYQMFADNIALFAAKAGSADAAFAIQTANLDTELQALPVTMNKILVAGGNLIKDTISLNGALTPLLSKFNGMDRGGQRAVATIALLGGQVAALKIVTQAFSVGAALKNRLLADGAKNQTAETAAITAASAAIRTQTASIAANIAARNNARINAGLEPFNDIRRSQIQERWDARAIRKQNNRSQGIFHFSDRIAALDGEAIAARNAARINSGYAPGKPAGNTRLAAEFSNIGQAAAAALSPTKNLAGELAHLSGRFPKGSSSMRAMWSEIVSGTKSAASAKTVISGVTSSVRGVVNALSGGQGGLAGALNMVGGGFVAVQTALSGWEFGKWLGEASRFNETIALLFMGAEAYAAEQSAKAAAAERKKRFDEQERQAKAAAATEEEKTAATIAATEADQRMSAALREYQLGRVGMLEKLSMRAADLLNLSYDIKRARAAGDKTREADLTVEYLRVKADRDQLQRDLLRRRQSRIDGRNAESDAMSAAMNSDRRSRYDDAFNFRADRLRERGDSAGLRQLISGDLVTVRRELNAAMRRWQDARISPGNFRSEEERQTWFDSSIADQRKARGEYETLLARQRQRENELRDVERSQSDRGRAIGDFSARNLAQLLGGSGSPQERTARAAERTVKLTEEVSAATRELNARFGRNTLVYGD